MSRIEVRTIKAPKRTNRCPRMGTAAEARQSAQQERHEFEAHKRRQARAARTQKQLTIRSDGVTRCSKCSHGFCDDCARINKARQHAGLIRPFGSPEPHPNNCMPCIPHSDGYLGGRSLVVKQPAQEIVSIDVKPLGGGWYEGSASLGLETIYTRKFRSAKEARRYAVNSMVDIRDGLKFERLLNG